MNSLRGNRPPKGFQKISIGGENNVGDTTAGGLGRRRLSTNSVHDYEATSGGGRNAAESSTTHFSDPEGHNNETTPLIQESYPKEYLKTLLSMFVLFVGASVGGFVIGYIHRFSVSQPSPPLPDLIFQLIPQQVWAWKVAEFFVILCPLIGSVVLLFNKHWTIVLRRMCLLGGVLYILRAGFLLCTYLPPPFPDKDLRCLPANFSDNKWDYFTHAFGLVFTVGYSGNAEQRIMCGDTIFSGHTMVFTLVSLFVWHHCPRPLYPWVPIVVLLYNCFGITMVTISRQHYTIDVAVALFVTYATFSGYLAWARRERCRRCFGLKPFAFRPVYFCFLIFEVNVAPGPLPCELAWPLPLPKGAVNLFDKINDWAQRPSAERKKSDVLDV